jgi:Fic family protein
MSILDLAPFIPSDKALGQSALPDKAVQLVNCAARLTGQLSPLTLVTLTHYMATINSYYSNLIEGNATRPHEIRAAQHGEYSRDAAKRDLQLESLAHIQVQEWLREQQPNLETLLSPDFIRRIHGEFYRRVPESLWVIKDERGRDVDKVAPGEWRSRSVKVGLHIPPDAADVEALMQRFCEIYQPKNFTGDRKLIAIMAAHHRFAYIHPFMDGNGRVGRLLTDAALKAAGLDSYGAWCLSRGLAKTASDYKNGLAAADSPRQGDYDGRGTLSEKNLISFCDYLFDTAIDQVNYLSNLLDIGGLRQRIDSYVRARNDGLITTMREPLKPVAGLILYTAFLHGEIDRGQALELCAMPERSARRVLSQLKSDGLLSETSSKSPLRWEIPEHAEAWYFPQLAPLD